MSLFSAQFVVRVEAQENETVSNNQTLVYLSSIGEQTQFLQIDRGQILQSSRNKRCLFKVCK